MTKLDKISNFWSDMLKYDAAIELSEYVNIEVHAKTRLLKHILPFPST